MMIKTKVRFICRCIMFVRNTLKWRFQSRC